MVFLANQPIQYAESSVAYRRFGSGTPVVFVGGALSTAEAASPLVAAFAEAGLQGVTYDRRGRGDSRDTAPYAPEREAEDLRAVIDAVDGAAVVLGHSSGAVLSLFAAAEGVPMTHLFLSEPPLRFGQNEPRADLPDRLQALVDQRENEEGSCSSCGSMSACPSQRSNSSARHRPSPVSSRSRRPPSTTTGSSRRCRHDCRDAGSRRADDAPPRRPDGAVDRHRRRATCCRDAGHGACGRAGVTRPWRRPHRHRSRGARPSRLIIAVRGAARTVGRTRAA